MLYAALSHLSYSNPSAKGLGAVLSIAPLILVGVILAWRWLHPLAGLLVAALLCGMFYWYWPVVERHYAWSDLAQQFGLYALVTVAFARSLFAGRVPLCAQLAGKSVTSAASSEVIYLRRATVAWTFFYALLTAAVLVLHFLVPLRTWSLFVNFATIGLISVAGVADLAIRYCILPRRQGDGILAIVRRSFIG